MFLTALLLWLSGGGGLLVQASDWPTDQKWSFCLLPAEWLWLSDFLPIRVTNINQYQRVDEKIRWDDIHKTLQCLAPNNQWELLLALDGAWLPLELVSYVSLPCYIMCRLFTSQGAGTGTYKWQTNTICQMALKVCQEEEKRVLGTNSVHYDFTQGPARHCLYFFHYHNTLPQTARVLESGTREVLSNQVSRSETAKGCSEIA